MGFGVKTKTKSFLANVFWHFYIKHSQARRIIPFPDKIIKIFHNSNHKKVFILTFCQTEEQLYGTTLIFKSLRTGFSNADVIVIDNASIPNARKVIKQLSAKANCYFFQLESEILHNKFLEEIILNQPLSGTVVILDPDIIFWENCENWKFNKLLAGSYIPAHIDEWTQSLVRPRIHTSFYWIQDIVKLRNIIKPLIEFYRNEFDPFLPVTFKEGSHWYRFDTGGSLYSVIQKYCHHFTEKEHSAFDHLFGGTHLNLFIDQIKPKNTKKSLIDIHTMAKIDPSKLQGIWKKQKHFFRMPK
jgi:hypothetical protein